MVRLLIALAVLGLAYYVFVRPSGDGDGARPEAIYRESTEKAEAVEEQLRRQADQQREAIERLEQ